MLAMWSNSVERGVNGEAVRADGARLSPGVLVHLLAGLPGLAPLLLNKLCARHGGKSKHPPKQGATHGDGDNGQAADAVVRIHQDPPALSRLRRTYQVCATGVYDSVQVHECGDWVAGRLRVSLPNTNKTNRERDRCCPVAADQHPAPSWAHCARRTAAT
jgi:hypothetical protein